MPDIKITNCHIHLFNSRYSPDNFPHPLLRLFRRAPRLIKFFAGAAKFIGQHQIADTLTRLYRFQQEADVEHQKDILESVQLHYPSNTRFVVLPMDLSQIGFGPAKASLREQHDELANLRNDPDLGHSIIPFATIDPRADPEARELWRAIDTHGFEGVKVYPRLGFAPDHPVLMSKVYPMMEERGLPLMSHCSRGGVQGRYLSDHTADRYSEPYAFRDVMRRFPKLRVCLAHFGGKRDWHAYANPEKPGIYMDEHRNNWQVMLREMMTGDKWPGLWTDISFTLFEFDDFIPFLEMFLLGQDEWNEKLRKRVMFGSDFYMTRQEQLSERAVCFRLRNTLGDEVFRRIAEENPAVWLGEQAERD